MQGQGRQAFQRVNEGEVLNPSFSHSFSPHFPLQTSFLLSWAPEPEVNPVAKKGGTH